MKKTNRINRQVSAVIEEENNIKFENHEFSLNGWGDVDNYVVIDKNTFIFLECENAQKHPNTNVLKLFPYLEENPEISITLIHFFFKENKAPNNRLALCDFIADKMKTQFGDRFNYKKIIQK